MKKVDSIVTSCMDYCYICGSPYVEIHHCIPGTANRSNSDKYGLVVPLCRKHHTGGPDSAHRNPDVGRRFKEIGQEAFEEKVGTREEFIEIFGKSWL